MCEVLDRRTMAIIEKLGRLKPGEKFVYFVGFLADRRRGSDPDILAIREATQEGLASGKLQLTQRRLGRPLCGNVIDTVDGVGPGFEYIATGR